MVRIHAVKTYENWYESVLYQRTLTVCKYIYTNEPYHLCDGSETEKIKIQTFAKRVTLKGQITDFIAFLKFSRITFWFSRFKHRGGPSRKFYRLIFPDIKFLGTQI